MLYFTSGQKSFFFFLVELNFKVPHQQNNTLPHLWLCQDLYVTGTSECIYVSYLVLTLNCLFLVNFPYTVYYQMQRNSPLPKTPFLKMRTKCCLKVVNNERQTRCVVEMIVVKAESDNGVKESQGFLSFGAFMCSCF